MRVTMIVLNNMAHDARVRKQARTLANAGHQVTVLALKDDSVPATECIDGFEIMRIGLASRPWGLGAIARLIKLVEYLLRCSLVALQTNAQVYHAHDANTLPIGWLAARLRRAALVYDSHEFERGRNWGASNLPALFRRLWVLPEQLFIRSADLVITVSTSIAEQLRQIYRIQRPLVILNCPEYHRPATSDRLRQDLAIGHDQKIVVYQGAVSANRGIEPLIEGAMLLPDIVVVVIGDGPQLPSLQRWVEQRGWQSRVYFTGYVSLEQLSSYTASADVGAALFQNVGLSHFFSLPNKLFEYLQAGLPVIVSNFPEMRSVVEQSGAGVSVSPTSPAEIAQGLQSILDDPARRAQLSAHAYQAGKVYQWANEAEKLLDAYDHLAHGLGPSAEPKTTDGR